jgi:radical SAM protein with 4Fe4S-binding SPASM domain
MLKSERNLPKLDLNITNKCNLRCKHCAFDSGIVKLDEMTLEQLTALLKQTKQLGGRKIDVTGGEPTTRKDYVEIIKIAKGLGYKVELVTNSLLLNREKLIMLKELGLDGVAISLDGSTWETHHNIRNISKEQYQKVRENIQTAVKLGFYTKINSTLFESNLHELTDIIKWGAEIGAKEVGLYYFTPIGRGNRNNVRSVEPLKWLNFVRTELVKVKDLLEVSLETPLLEKELYTPEMGCIWNVDAYHLQVLPDGNVYPCAIMASYMKSVGNLHQNTVAEIWNDKNIWVRYHGVLKDLFNQHGGCVNFPNFDLRKYPGHTFVCPLRKFLVEDLII